MDPSEWATMTFDPQMQVNVRGLIDVMRGRAIPGGKDQWEDTKECIADCLEQFLELRRKV
jgi:hypothetical protein